MMVRTISVIMLISLLGACSSTRTGSLCTTGPFITSPGSSERWTRDEKEQLVVLNESGVKICGWKQP